MSRSEMAHKYSFLDFAAAFASCPEEEKCHFPSGWWRARPFVFLCAFDLSDLSARRHWGRADTLAHTRALRAIRADNKLLIIIYAFVNRSCFRIQSDLFLAKERARHSISANEPTSRQRQPGRPKRTERESRAEEYYCKVIFLIRIYARAAATENSSNKRNLRASTERTNKAEKVSRNRCRSPLHRAP